MRTILILTAALAVSSLAAACPAPGQWVDATGRPARPDAVLAAADAAQVLLLGERHATAAHHRWQANVIAAMAERGPITIGLEQLPRDAQDVLDRWVAGTIDEQAFMQESQWKTRWGHNFAAYRPVFALAQARGIPMRALNIDRAFVRAVGRTGFDAAAADGKAPISRPAAPDPAYVATLEESFRQHMKAPSPEALARFVEAQASWDRAMAESIVHALRDRPGTRMVAIMGWGHVAGGHGVAHQLRALAVPGVVSAIPVDPGAGCEPAVGSADFLYGAR